MTWLLTSSSGHLLLRLSGQKADFDRTANVVGVSMLIPMPVVWARDVVMITSGRYGLVVMAVSHALFQVWETDLGVIGLRRVLGVGTRMSIVVAVARNLIFVMMGAFFPANGSLRSYGWANDPAHLWGTQGWLRSGVRDCDA